MGSCCQPCEAYFSRPSFRRLFAGCLVEFIGTFFYALVFAMALASALGNQADNIYAPLVIGFFVGAMTFVGVQICGKQDVTGHYNPVISMAIAMENPAFGWERLIYFIIFQLLGGLFGGFTGAWVFGNANFLPVVPTQTTGLLVEFLFSFIIVLIAIRTVQKRDMYGFAIGAAIFAGMSVSGTVSGGVFNPAVALGLYAGAAAQGSVPSNMISNLFVYIFGPLLGAAAAVLFIGIVTTLQGPVGDDAYTSGEESDYKPEPKPAYKPKEEYKPEPQPAYEQPKPQPAYEQPKPQPAYEQPQPAYAAEPVQTYSQQASGYAAPQGYSSGGEQVVVQDYVQRNPVVQGYSQDAAIARSYSPQQASYGQGTGIELGQMMQAPMYVVQPNNGPQLM